jgi:hypothetical protein
VEWLRLRERKRERERERRRGVEGGGKVEGLDRKGGCEPAKQNSNSKKKMSTLLATRLL